VVPQKVPLLFLAARRTDGFDLRLEDPANQPAVVPAILAQRVGCVARR
jgi:hypothetical protein